MDGVLQKQCGYTLLELMLALAIAALLASLSTPTFRAMAARVEINQASSALHLTINQARSEAIKSGLRATLCPLPTPPEKTAKSSKSANSANSSCATRKDSHWHNGWMLFVDKNADGSRSDDEVILSTQQRDTGSLRADGNRFVKAYISYTPLGESRLAKGSLAGGFYQMGTITFCSQHSDSGYQIVINRAGRASKRELDCSK